MYFRFNVSHGSESLNIITKGNYLKKDCFDNYKN